MTNLKNIIKMLAIEGIETSITYDIERDQLYIDLNTMAKSHLYLYEDGVLRGRYEYETQIDLEDTDSLLRSLCFEFKDALCGRNYYNGNWAKLCKKYEINIEQI